MKSNDLTNILSSLVHLLYYANSAINPLIYNFMSGEYDHFQNIFHSEVSVVFFSSIMYHEKFFFIKIGNKKIAFENINFRHFVTMGRCTSQ